MVALIGIVVGTGVVFVVVVTDGLLATVGAKGTTGLAAFVAGHNPIALK